VGLEVDPSCQKKTKTWLKKGKIYREESSSGRCTAKTVSKARKNKERKTKKKQCFHHSASSQLAVRCLRLRVVLGYDVFFKKIRMLELRSF